MRAVVVDIEGKYAVVLSKSGSFIKVRNSKEYKVGHEIDVPSAGIVKINSITRMVSVAAVILLVVGIGFGAFAYNSPYSYINVDINPSIEITTNVFDRIIGVKALNTDGEKVLSNKSYRSLKLEDGIESILESAVNTGYLKADTEKGSGNIEAPANAVMFTVSGKSEKKVLQIEKDIKNTAEKELKAVKVESEVVVEKVSVKSREKANDMGVSPGKMLLLEELQEARPDVKAEEYKNAPVKDIMKIIKSEKNKKQGKNASDSGKGKAGTIPEKKVNQVKEDNPPEKGKQNNEQEEKSKQNKNNKGNQDLKKDKSDKDNKAVKENKNNGVKDKSNTKEGRKTPLQKFNSVEEDNSSKGKSGSDKQNSKSKDVDKPGKQKDDAGKEKGRKDEKEFTQLSQGTPNIVEGTGLKDKPGGEEKKEQGGKPENDKKDKGSGGSENNSNGNGHKKDKN